MRNTYLAEKALLRDCRTKITCGGIICSDRLLRSNVVYVFNIEGGDLCFEASRGGEVFVAV